MEHVKLEARGYKAGYMCGCGDENFSAKVTTLGEQNCKCENPVLENKLVTFFPP